MRIDLPGCGLKTCRYYFDGNCTDKNKYEKCDYASIKEENINLEYTLAGVMHFVDKWLEGEELNQNEVNRAATMREKTLKIIEKQDAEIADREQSHIDLYCEMRTYRDEVKRLKEMVGED